MAMPILGDQVRMTNNERWSFSIEATRQALGLERLVLAQRFTALALAVPQLQADESRQVGGGVAVAGEAIGLIGPGTGCGVSDWCRHKGAGCPCAARGACHGCAHERTGMDIAHRFATALRPCLLGTVAVRPGLLNLYQILAERPPYHQQN